MQRAIFLDRDGVINYLVLNPKTNEYEAPANPSTFKLMPYVIESLKELINLNYKLILVSNQPDYAKGKTSLENLKLVHEKMHSIFVENNVTFTEYDYCFHHPEGTVPEYKIICKCRKPGDLFLQEAKKNHNLDMASSWMIGDRDSDIYCGQSSGSKTILVVLSESAPKAGKSKPDYKVSSLKEALEVIRNTNKWVNK